VVTSPCQIVVTSYSSYPMARLIASIASFELALLVRISPTSGSSSSAFNAICAFIHLPRA